MDKVVHYVFSTFKRKQILVDEVARDLGVLFEGICNEKGFKIIRKNILVDHVHLLINKNWSDRNEYVMKMIKGISANSIFNKYSVNRLEFRKLWGRGHHAKEIKNAEQLKQVIAYIDGQKINGVDKRERQNRKPRRLVAGFQKATGKELK